MDYPKDNLLLCVKCQVCHRLVYQRDITKHHWHPKYQKRKNSFIIEMCNTCHRFIHKIIPIEDIIKYATPESFRQIPLFQLYLSYISTVQHPHSIPLKKLIKQLELFQTQQKTIQKS